MRYYEPITHSYSLNESKNHLYNINTQFDITFLITFFLSLFILLISYDSVNGEKQVGTLRLLLTYPIKRQMFILKKMLGIFIFVAFSFSLPFIISIISLIIIYANLLTINFFLSVFFYWLLAIMFILFFTLLGLFISTCCLNPNRSLVFSLLIWIVLALVMPISWTYIISPLLYNEQLNRLNQIYHNKFNQALRLTRDDLPDESTTYEVDHDLWIDNFYDLNIFSFKDTFDDLTEIQIRTYENYYPASRETELAIDDVYRKQVAIDNTKNLFFFYNPIVLFNSLSMKITGNSREEHMTFLQTTRDLRNEIVNIGVNEGWLFDHRFYTIFALEHLRYRDDLLEEHGDMNLVWGTYFNTEEYEYFNFELPVFRRYQQPQNTFGEIFNKILTSFLLFVFGIIALWIMTWFSIMKYDVR